MLLLFLSCYLQSSIVITCSCSNTSIDVDVGKRAYGLAVDLQEYSTRSKLTLLPTQYVVA